MARSSGRRVTTPATAQQPTLERMPGASHNNGMSSASPWSERLGCPPRPGKPAPSWAMNVARRPARAKWALVYTLARAAESAARSADCGAVAISRQPGPSSAHTWSTGIAPASSVSTRFRSCSSSVAIVSDDQQRLAAITGCGAPEEPRHESSTMHSNSQDTRAPIPEEAARSTIRWSWKRERAPAVARRIPPRRMPRRRQKGTDAPSPCPPRPAPTSPPRAATGCRRVPTTGWRR